MVEERVAGAVEDAHDEGPVGEVEAGGAQRQEHRPTLTGVPPAPARVGPPDLHLQERRRLARRRPGAPRRRSLPSPGRPRPGCDAPRGRGRAGRRGAPGGAGPSRRRDASPGATRARRSGSPRPNAGRRAVAPGRGRRSRARPPPGAATARRPPPRRPRCEAPGSTNEGRARTAQSAPAVAARDEGPTPAVGEHAEADDDARSQPRGGRRAPRAAEPTPSGPRRPPTPGARRWAGAGARRPEARPRRRRRPAVRPHAMTGPAAGHGQQVGRQGDDRQAAEHRDQHGRHAELGGQRDGQRLGHRAGARQKAPQRRGPQHDARGWPRPTARTRASRRSSGSTRMHGGDGEGEHPEPRARTDPGRWPCRPPRPWPRPAAPTARSG